MKEIERVLKSNGIAIIATEYMLKDKEHPEFFNNRTIYSDLINRLDILKLVELDLRITTNTLDTVMDYPSVANWNASPEEFKKSHLVILIRFKSILLTSVMIVFQKQ